MRHLCSRRAPTQGHPKCVLTDARCGALEWHEQTCLPSLSPSPSLSTAPQHRAPTAESGLVRRAAHPGTARRGMGGAHLASSPQGPAGTALRGLGGELRGVLHHTPPTPTPGPGKPTPSLSLSQMTPPLCLLQTTVLQVKRRPDFSSSGQWEVVTQSAGKEQSAIFDAVMVCSGHHILPHMPLQSFPGEARGFAVGSRCPGLLPGLGE